MQGILWEGDDADKFKEAIDNVGDDIDHIKVVDLTEEDLRLICAKDNHDLNIDQVANLVYKFTQSTKFKAKLVLELRE